MSLLKEAENRGSGEKMAYLRGYSGTSGPPGGVQVVTYVNLPNNQQYIQTGNARIAPSPEVAQATYPQPQQQGYSPQQQQGYPPNQQNGVYASPQAQPYGYQTVPGQPTPYAQPVSDGPYGQQMKRDY